MPARLRRCASAGRTALGSHVFSPARGADESCRYVPMRELPPLLIRLRSLGIDDEVIDQVRRHSGPLAVSRDRG
jgi:hypothetical protein